MASGELLFHPTVSNYTALWTGNFPASFANSMITSGVSTALALLVGVPAAYVLSRWRFRARRQIALWILATRMAPPIAFTIPFFLAYPLSWADRHPLRAHPDLSRPSTSRW